jgi:hypothetical protein
MWQAPGTRECGSVCRSLVLVRAANTCHVVERMRRALGGGGLLSALGECGLRACRCARFGLWLELGRVVARVAAHGLCLLLCGANFFDRSAPALQVYDGSPFRTSFFVLLPSISDLRKGPMLEHGSPNLTAFEVQRPPDNRDALVERRPRLRIVVPIACGRSRSA